jgi:hypothetical protein
LIAGGYRRIFVRSAGPPAAPRHGTSRLQSTASSSASATS